MKQRLLLVLLALFTSIGWMTAQNNTVTIIVPKNSGDVSISVSGMDSKKQFTAENDKKIETDPKDLGTGWTSKSFKLKNNASSETAWTLSGDFTGLTISNASVKSIAVNHSTLKTLTASSINLTGIIFTNAPVLETVNVSTNQLKEITGVPASVKTLNISGNQISNIKDLAIEGRTVTYGTQTVDKTSVSDIVANKWADLKSKLSITDLFLKPQKKAPTAILSKNCQAVPLGVRQMSARTHQMQICTVSNRQPLMSMELIKFPSQTIKFRD